MSSHPTAEPHTPLQLLHGEDNEQDRAAIGRALGAAAVALGLEVLRALEKISYALALMDWQNSPRIPPAAVFAL